MIDALFPLQRAFVESPAKRKVNHAGRRGGKTHAALARALKGAAQFPGMVIPVFERTLTCVAANTFWKLLQDVDEQFKLGMVFHHTLRTATCPNHAVIALLGADTIEAADKHRGGKFPVAIVDEAGTFRSKVLDYLLTDVLEPATMDLDGEIVVIGTPSIDAAGTWFEMCHNAAWTRFHWTALDNTELGPRELNEADRRAWRADWLRDLRTRLGWTETSPRYVREYLGGWTRDADERMFAFDRRVNVIDALPEPTTHEWRYILAMDLGYNDPCAFVVLALRDDDPCLYVVESYERTELIPSAVAAQVEGLRKRYSFMIMVADTGGYGKGVVEEMRQTYSLPIEAAKKRDKRVFVEHVSGELGTGRIQIVGSDNVELIDDLISLPWNEDRSDAEPGFRDHLPDAFLYGAREGVRYLSGRGLGDRDGPTPGTDEWYLAEEEAMEAAAEAEYAAKHPVDLSWRDKYTIGHDEDDWEDAA